MKYKWHISKSNYFDFNIIVVSVWVSFERRKKTEHWTVTEQRVSKAWKDILWCDLFGKHSEMYFAYTLKFVWSDDDVCQKNVNTVPNKFIWKLLWNACAIESQKEKDNLNFHLWVNGRQFRQHANHVSQNQLPTYI